MSRSWGVANLGKRARPGDLPSANFVTKLFSLHFKVTKVAMRGMLTTRLPSRVPYGQFKSSNPSMTTQYLRTKSREHFTAMSSGNALEGGLLAVQHVTNARLLLRESYRTIIQCYSLP
jgi:hypothetical protein